MKRLLFTLLGALLTLAAAANGISVAYVSAIERTANPAPRTITDIRVLRQELRITPGRYYTAVSVRYYLHNSSKNDYRDIDYAFPIDYRGSDRYPPLLATPLGWDAILASGWSDDYIREVTFHANGRALPFEISDETTLRTPRELLHEDSYAHWESLDERAKIFHGSFYTLSRKWFYTRFTLLAGEQLVLDVDYRLLNNLSLVEGIEELKPMEWGQIDGTFHYDLTPARHWGDGTAGEMFIEIDTRQVELSSSNDYPLKMESRNFHYASARPIELSFIVPPATTSEWLSARIDPARYTLSASVELDDYPLSNLSDMEITTAYAARWRGEPITLTITFDEPITSLGGLMLLPGYQKSEKAFYENARPRSMRMDIQGEDGRWWYEGAPQPLYITPVAWNWEDVEAGRVPEQPPYGPVDPEQLLRGAFYYPDAHFTRPAKRITLTIPDVYPGTRYADLCLTELVLLGPGTSVIDRIFRGPARKWWHDFYNPDDPNSQ